MDFWSIIGRACLDKNFLTELQKRAEPGEMDTSKLNELWQYLSDAPYNYRFTLWELGEINRILDEVQKVVTANPVTSFQNMFSWMGLPPSREAHALLGLSCIDKRFRDAVADLTNQVQQSTDPVAAWRIAPLRPKFEVTKNDIDNFPRIFQDASFNQLLYKIYDLIWIVPELSVAGDRPPTLCAGACIPGDGTPAFYLHSPSPLIERMPFETRRTLIEEKGQLSLAATAA